MSFCGSSDWPAWRHFKQTFISRDGRVIDPATAHQYTTSEGQSYALFFALVDNDPALFEQLLKWTENNLAQGDLTSHLPAWQWGRQSADGLWRVQDTNAATDADLWLAYTLTQAGNLWHSPRYSALGQLIAERILAEESSELPQLGLMLLPGIQGFHPTPDVWRLNPSYLPPSLLQSLATHYPHRGWDEILNHSVRMLNAVSAHHVVPDWLSYGPQGFTPDSATGDLGSYDAIRVYLWVGLMAPSALRSHLLSQIDGMVSDIDIHDFPPENTHWLSGRTEGKASPGFSAALLPYLIGLQRDHAAQSQLMRVRNDTLSLPNYYDQALTLFGLGWVDRHYQFSEKGDLMPYWSCSQTPVIH